MLVIKIETGDEDEIFRGLEIRMLPKKKFSVYFFAAGEGYIEVIVGTIWRSNRT